MEKVKKAQGNFQQNYVNSEVMRASKKALPDLFMKCSEKNEKCMDRIEEVIGHFNRLREGRKEPHMDFGIGKREDAPKMTNNFCQMGAPDRINRILIEYDPDYEYFLILVFPQE